MVKENITLFIAIVGFAASMYNFFERLYSKRVSIECRTKSLFLIANKENVFQLLISNKSSDAIIIEKIEIFTMGEEHPVGNYRRLVLETKDWKGKEIKEIKRWHSSTFPIALGPKTYAKGLFALDNSAEIVKPNQVFEYFVYTNKGLVQIKDVVSAHTDASLLSQCQEPDFLWRA